VSGKFREIEISRLREDPHRSKREIDRVLVAALKESTSSDCGQLQPIIVRHNKYDKRYYWVIAGMHRLTAALQAGDKKIMCKVLAKCSDEQAKEISLRENLDRGLNDADERRARAELAAMLGKRERNQRYLQEQSDLRCGRGRPPSPERVGMRKAAEVAGVTERTIERDVTYMSKLCPEAKRAVLNDEINTKDADKLTRLPPEKQVEQLKIMRKPQVLEDVQEDPRVGRFIELVNALTKVESKHLFRFVKSLDTAPPDFFSGIEERELIRLARFVKAMRSLLAEIPKDLKAKLEAAVSLVASDQEVTAS
jgi:ParB-like nuclease domain